MTYSGNNLYKDLRRIGERAHTGVFIYSHADKCFIYVNEPFARIFHAQVGDIMADPRSVLTYIFSEDHPYLFSRMEQLMTEGSIDGAELKLMTSGNMQLHLLCDAYLIDEGAGIVAGFVKDITDEKEHENFLVDISAQKDSFLDMITHNLSGPLMMTQNLLNWMQRSMNDGRPQGNVAPLLNMLQESTQECIDIVEDFLTEEHKESGRIFVKKTRFSVVEKINTVLDKLQELSPDKHFTLTVTAADHFINTDSVKFFQIIHNLISNAIKFTGEGGKIDILVADEMGEYVFSVTDNGIGIPDNMKPHVFDKKTIAGREGLKGERSHGIGLSIIKKLAEVIGGTLSFDSEEGRGSVFYLRLPKE